MPLYKQGNTNLCWVYSQTMVESFNNNEKLKKKAADARAKEIAIAYNGADDWNRGGWPDGVDPSAQVTVGSIEALYDIVVEHGPVYAYYWNGLSGDDSAAHLVVVTGVSVYKNKVYTNNPSGKKGSQSFDAFLDGVARKSNQDSMGMTFRCIYLYD